MKVIAIWGIIAIVSAALAGVIAGYKRRDHSWWVAWTFLLPPMLVVLLLMPRNTGARPRRPTLDEQDAHSD